MFRNTVARLICVLYCFDQALVNIICLLFDSCCNQKLMFNHQKIIIMAKICGTFVYLTWMCFQLEWFKISWDIAVIFSQIIYMKVIWRHYSCMGTTTFILFFMLWKEWWVIDYQCSAITNQDVTYHRKFNNIVYVIQKKARPHSFIMTDLNQICKHTVKDFAHWSVKCRQYTSG